MDDGHNVARVAAIKGQSNLPSCLCLLECVSFCVCLSVSVCVCLPVPVPVSVFLCVRVRECLVLVFVVLRGGGLEDIAAAVNSQPPCGTILFFWVI